MANGVYRKLRSNVPPRSTEQFIPQLSSRTVPVRRPVLQEKIFPQQLVTLGATSRDLEGSQ